MSVGSFVFLLHSHLPYYRKAGMWPFGEESVYECMAETYIPLLNLIEDLYKEEGIKANLTIGITPVLAEQLSDKHMIEGFISYLSRKLEDASTDESKFHQRGEKPNAEMRELARFYKKWYSKTLEDFTQRWSKDLVGAFKKMQDEGLIEITTSAATHCLTPLLNEDMSIKLQFESGVKNYEKHFGKKPKGFWLPECAYRPETEDRPAIGHWLSDSEIEYFVTESFVITGGDSSQMKVIGPYGEIEYLPKLKESETGFDTFSAFKLKDFPVSILGRHETLGYQVWSKDYGYPGDGEYREFHKRDDDSGLNYWRLTSKEIDLADKHLYVPETAKQRVNENSDHYVGLIQRELHNHFKATGEPGLVLVAFDTELFGHWWFEGMEFVKQVIRKLNKYTKIAITKASDCLSEMPAKNVLEVPPSSWGSGGHWDVWSNKDTDWLWDDIHKAEAEFKKRIIEFDKKDKDELSQRILKQCAIELMLMQSSDWPFLITTGQAKQYAIDRFKKHDEKFWKLIDLLKQDNANTPTYLEEVESTDNCFSELDLSSLKREAKDLAAGTK